MGILGSWKMARTKTQINPISCIGGFVAFKVQLKRPKHRSLDPFNTVLHTQFSAKDNPSWCPRSPSPPPVESTSHSCNSLSSLVFLLVIGSNVAIKIPDILSE